MSHISTRELKLCGVKAALRGLGVRVDDNKLWLVGPQFVAQEFSPDCVELVQLLLAWSAEWTRLAFPIVQMSHRYAAALMATTPPSDDIRAPWPFFLLNVPAGLVHSPGKNGDREVVDRMCCVYLRERWTFCALAQSVELHELYRSTTYLRGEDLRSNEDAFPSLIRGDLPLESEDKRACQVLCRLLLNTCAAMNDPRLVRCIGKGHAQWEAKQPPDIDYARVFEIGKPVNVDCREAVQDYISGRRSSMPKVRWLVRGHWTHQAHGPGRTLRRLQWIEPYWKGTETAPVNVRPHVLRGES